MEYEGFAGAGVIFNHDGTYEFTRVLDRSRDALNRDTGFQRKDGNTIENQATYGYSITALHVQLNSKIQSHPHRDRPRLHGHKHLGTGPERPGQQAKQSWRRHHFQV